MDAAANEGGTLEERLFRLAIVGFERIQSDVYAPHLQPTSTSTTRTTSSSTRRWTSSRSPVIRCFAEAGPADPQLAPKAASELLAGVLFSLIFAPASRAATARCQRTGWSGRCSRSACSCGGYWSLARGEDQRA